MPRSLSTVWGEAPFPAGPVSSTAEQGAGPVLGGQHRVAGREPARVTWRRSAPQQLVRLMVLAQVPGGLSPARPARPRGACPQAGQVSHSRTPWVVQANTQPSRQASSHRPSRSARHDGQYQDPRRRTGPSGR